MKFLKLLVFALVFPLVASAQVDTTSAHFYLFIYFINTVDAAGARLAVSSDAINWQKINNEAPIFVPAISAEHLCRDPNTCYDARTGTFHMVWTSGWNTDNIGYSSSKDLKTWTPQLAIPVGAQIPGCQLCWAPEIFYDDIKDSFMVYWSTDAGVNGKRTYYTLTKDFKSFTAPVKFFDPGYTVIDATILKAAAGKYYMFFKDERTPSDAGKQAKNIHYVTGPTPQGPWDKGPWDNVSNPITTVGTEGPTAIKIGTDYLIYFDPYADFSSTYRSVKVTDLATTTSPWPVGPVMKTTTGNFLISHGSISEIPKAKLMQLLYDQPDPTSYASWSVPTQSDIKVVQGTTDLLKYPLGKQNYGCGTGVGLALLPPLCFKVMARRKRKKKTA